MARIGIFGGSFNPVHNGHVIMALCAKEAAGLDRVLVMPAASSPHKEAQDSWPADLRVRCLELAFEGLSGFTIDAREIHRGGISYTVDTLEALHEEHPGDSLHLLMGADSLRSLLMWRAPDRIARLARILVFPRLDTGPDVAAKITAMVPGVVIEPVATPLVDISSTLVRQRVAERLPLRGFVPDDVARLISGQV
jgi:nicotinate-nucleotide adenylyltransferase